ATASGLSVQFFPSRGVTPGGPDPRHCAQHATVGFRRLGAATPRSRRRAQTGRTSAPSPAPVASAGGAVIGPPSDVDDLVEGPFQGEAGFAAVREDRGREELRSLREARGSLWGARVVVHDLVSS